MINASHTYLSSFISQCMNFEYSDHRKQTSLMLLCFQGRLQQVKRIIVKMNDINQVDCNQENALFHATSSKDLNNDSVLRVLLLHGMNYRQKNSTGVSSLENSIRNEL